jgi:predicted hotdog family 3-hydroxylacyl-ACP dehydratase
MDGWATHFTRATSMIRFDTSIALLDGIMHYDSDEMICYVFSRRNYPFCA